MSETTTLSPARKLLAVLMAIVLAVGLMPMPRGVAWAADGDPDEPATPKDVGSFNVTVNGATSDVELAYGTGATLGTSIDIGNNEGIQISYAFYDAASEGNVVDGVTAITSSTPVGTYYAQASVVADDNYAAKTSNNRVKVEVTAKEVGLAWAADPAYTYDGEEHSYTAPTVTGTANDEAVIPVVDAATLTKTAAGTYTVTVTGLKIGNDDAANYKLPDSVTNNWTIAKKEVGIAWGATDLPYTGEAQAPKADVSGAIDGDEVTATVTGVQTDIGNQYTAEVTALDGTAKDNYKLPSSNLKTFFNIVKATDNAATVELDNWTFEGTPSELKFESTLGSDTVQYVYSDDGENWSLNTQPTDAGHYWVKATVATTESYAGAEATAEFDILQKEVGLTWADGSVGAYTGNVQTYSGVTAVTDPTKSGSTISHLSVTYLDDSNKAITAGTHTATAETIVSSDESVKASNYKLPDNASNDWSISPVEVGFTWDTTTEYTYDGTEQTYELPTVTGAVNDDALTAVVAPEDLKATDAGDHVVTVTGLAGDAKDNYTLPSNATHTWTIAPMTAELEWDADTALVYTGGEIAPGASVKNLKARDEGKVGVTVTGKQTNVNTGYTATASVLTGDAAKNYKLPSSGPDSNLTCEFSITKAPNAATVTIGSWTYGETAKAPAADATFGKDSATFEYSTARDGSYDGTQPTNAGHYWVKAIVVGNTNYDGATSDPVEFDISKAPLTIKAKDAAVKKGDEPDEFQVTYEGFVKGETDSVVTTKATCTTDYVAATSDVGTYEIVSAGAVAANYEISYENGTLTVASGAVKTITIAATDHGAVEAPSSAAVSTEVTPTITPDLAEGYELDTITVTKETGSAEVQVTNGAFIMPDDNVTITVTFKQTDFTVTVKSGIENGTVRSDMATAHKGDEVTLTVEATDGYKLTEGSLKANGEAVDETTKKFTMPAANVVVDASFEAIPYTITVTKPSGEHGTVSASKDTANVDDVITLTANLEEGWEIDTWGVSDSDSSPVTVSKENTFTMPAKNVTVAPTLKQTEYTATVDPGMANGSVTLSKTTGLHKGDEVTVTAVTPADSTYQLAEGSLKVDGVEIADSKFTMPAKNVTVTAEFELKPFAITISGNDVEKGTVTAPATAVKGASVPLTIETVGDYALGTITADHGSITRDEGECTLAMPGEAVTITVTWVEAPKTEIANSETSFSAAENDVDGTAETGYTITPDEATATVMVGSTPVVLEPGKGIVATVSAEGDVKVTQAGVGSTFYTPNAVDDDEVDEAAEASIVEWPKAAEATDADGNKLDPNTVNMIKVDLDPLSADVLEIDVTAYKNSSPLSGVTFKGAELTIKVPTGLSEGDEENYTLYYIDDAEGDEEIQFELDENGIMSFTTDHLSTWELRANNPTPEPTPTPTPTTTPSNPLENVTYAITVAAAEHGAIAADRVNAKAGDTVTLTATPDEGYELASVAVATAAGEAVAVANGKFTMPAANVTVTASFKASTTPAPEPAPVETKTVAAPTAKAGLVYTGKAQTGVAAAEGYAVTGGSATAAGDHTATATLASGYAWSDGTTAPKTITWSIAKAENPVKVAKKARTAKKVSKKNVTVKGPVVKAKGAGKVTYSKVKVNKSAKKFSVNAKTGKITVKKGTKKGTYKVTVRATAAGDANYASGWSQAVVTVKVKK